MHTKVHVNFLVLVVSFYYVLALLRRYFVYIRPDDPNPTRAGMRLLLSTLFHVRTVEEALFPADAQFPDRLLRFMKYAEIIFEAIPMAVLSYFLVLWNPNGEF